MNAEQLLEALANVVGQAQGTVETVVESEEMKAAKAARTEKINAVARDFAGDLREVLEKYDLDAKVCLQFLNASVTPFISVRDQYFWSIDRADKSAQRLARMQATGQWEDDARGGMKDSSDDGTEGNGEINPMRQAEEAIQYHNRNAEQYEILMHAVQFAWTLFENDVVEAGGEAGFIPEFDLGEQAFQTYLTRQQQRQNRSSKNQQAQADVQAARIERATTTSFLD